MRVSFDALPKIPRVSRLMEEHPPRSVAILRALQVGDMLCAIPALRAFRAAFPDAHVTLVGLPWASDWVRRFDRYFDAFIAFPGYPGLPERVPREGEIASFMREMRARRFDAVLQLHGSGKIVNDLVRRFGARVNAGYYEDPSDRLDPYRFLRYPEGLPEVRRHLKLMEFLGIPSQGEHLEFPLLPEDEAGLQAIFSEHRLSPGRYVCLHAGARARARRWLPERFAAVADEIAQGGVRVALTGSGEERELARRIQKLMKRPSLNLAGPMTLGTLAALIGQARLLVCNDTGVSHLAAALRVRSVVIFTGSDPRRWAPLDALRHRAVYSEIDCRPCGYMDCPKGQPCATAVGALAVLHEVNALQRDRAYAI
jgi:ADP-heptose:LPS heptosyltransferase